MDLLTRGLGIIGILFVVLFLIPVLVISVLRNVEAGTIRPIVQTGKERNQFIAKVPTVAESGFPGFEAYAWWGIFAPAGTPKNIVERFGNEMAATLREERIAKQLVETQQVTLTLGGPKAERAFVSNQMQTWGKVVKDNNIKADQN